MKIRCNLCINFGIRGTGKRNEGFCYEKHKAKKGKAIRMSANKRRRCDYFNLDEEEATRILNLPKPKIITRPEGYFNWMDRSKRKKLKKEYEKEVEDTYISQFSSTAAEEDTTKTEENKGVSDDERLF